MKTYVIMVSGQTIIEVNKTLSYVYRKICSKDLFGKGGVAYGLFEGFGYFSFNSYGEYERVWSDEVESLIRKAENMQKELWLGFEDNDYFELHEIDEKKANEYNKVVEPIGSYYEQYHESAIKVKISLSAKSQYFIEKYLGFILSELNCGILSCKPSYITMNSDDMSGYCSFESSGYYHNGKVKYDDSITTHTRRLDYDIYEERNDTYCSACQQDPCECSDREKTSTIHDF